jgi:hypothetical protein
MVNKDTKQNEKKKRKKGRTASYHHLVVPAGTDVINVHENVSAHEDVVEEHTVAATELVEEQSITDKDGNVTSFAEMPALHSPPPVNSKRKHNQEYESKHDENWNRLFMELVGYKETNGHCNIPIKGNKSLGTWIHTQRCLNRSKKLKADRYEKLVGIGFTFVYESSIWNKQFMELVEYKEKNGHCNIPIKENGSLGTWVAHQRVLFRSKKLKVDRYEKLVGIGFAFEDARFASDHEKWNRCFMELVEYKEKNGHCNCPTKNGSLGIWISTQRTFFRSNKLKEDRHEKLVGIGFAFEDANFANSKKHIVAATELVEEQSITDRDENVTSLAGMPALHSPPPVNSKTKYTQAYESKLHDKWNIVFMELEKYKEKNGHCNFLTTSGSFEIWISTQRAMFRSKKLKPDRYEKLVGIGFAFEDANFANSKKHTVAATELVEEQSITDRDENVTGLAGMPALHSPPPVNSKTKCTQAYESKFDENWNILFMELVEYKETNGHCNCPTTNGSLGTWINRQRTLNRSNKLKADRYEKLVRIGFAFEDPRFAYDHEKWNRHFMELVKYKQKNGHCNIPTTNGSLGGWIKRQRELFRSNKLKEDRHEKLVEIGFAFEDVTALELKGKCDQQWQDMYQKLLEHKEMKGHCFNVPQTLPLGRWLRFQRQLYRNGNLRDDRAEKLLSIGFDDKKGLKKGGAVGVHDATSGQPPSRKNRKVLDLDNDSAAITHDEGEEGIDYINAEDDDNDNGNTHKEVIEKYTVAATELVEEGIKEGQKENDVAPHLEENIEFMKTVQV